MSAALSAVSTNVAKADTTSSANAAFDELIDQIESSNQALASSRAEFEARRLAASAENNPADPEVEFEHQWGRQDIGNKWTISLSQSFEWPGVYAKRRKAIRATSEALDYLYLADRADFRLKVRQTLIDYVDAVKRLRLAETVKTNLDSIYSKITQAYGHGEATILDIKKIGLERAAATTRVESAQNRLDALRYELIAMNGGKHVDLGSIIDYPEVTFLSEEKYLDMLYESDPSLIAAERQAEAARQVAATERLKSMPGFSIGYIHNVEMGDHFNGFKVGVSLPFFSNRHRHAAALSEALSFERQATDQTFAARSRIISDYASAKGTQRLIADYSDIFPADRDDDYAVLLRKSFDGGQINFITYLLELNYYIDARSDYLDLLHRYNQLLASLNRYQ